MTNTAPGWHPDPYSPSTHLRWWDGHIWTEHIHPLHGVIQGPPPYVQNPYQNQPIPQSYGPANSIVSQKRSGYNYGNASTFQANMYSFYTFGFFALYIFITLSVHFVILGIAPLIFSIRAMTRRESLAPLALIVAIGGMAFAIWYLKQGMP